MSLIFLVGMPAVGKSYWGKAWAASHGYEFRDIDEHIEVRAGLTIPDIFKSVGETGFRTLEGVVLLESISMARDKNMIIATGGGTPTYDDNMGIMLRSGCVIHLTADTPTLLRHIAKSSTVRPLLQNCDTTILEQLRTAREPYYSRAHMAIEVDKIGHDTFDQIKNQCTNLRLQQAL